MWKKILVIIFLFYFLVLLQNSLLSHFTLFGTTPNLIFIFFFLLIFFSPMGKNFIEVYQIILWGALAGFFLDVFSYSYIGPSVVLLIAIGFLAKKTQSLLRDMDDNFPFAYFLPLFVVFFIVYQILLLIYLRFFDPSHYLMIFDLRIIAEIIYNLFFAAIGFWIIKRILPYVK